MSVLGLPRFLLGSSSLDRTCPGKYSRIGWGLSVIAIPSVSFGTFWLWTGTLPGEIRPCHASHSRSAATGATRTGAGCFEMCCSFARSTRKTERRAGRKPDPALPVRKAETLFWLGGVRFLWFIYSYAILGSERPADDLYCFLRLKNDQNNALSCFEGRVFLKLIFFFNKKIIFLNIKNCIQEVILQ